MVGVGRTVQVVPLSEDFTISVIHKGIVILRIVCIIRFPFLSYM